jgi:hypothetical protein
MNYRSNTVGAVTLAGALSNLLKIIGFIAIFPLMAGAVLAQSSRKATGEVVSASQVTINGFSAISGMTVFSNNQIKTGHQGAAIINLGKLGRIEFGSGADMTLRFSERGIGGDLRSNRMVISAGAGIPITVITSKGVVTTDGRQPAALTIYVDNKRANVITHLGAATVIPNNEKSPEREQVHGKEAPQSTYSGNWQSATGLFKAGINYSIPLKLDGNPSHEESLESSVTCRDSENKSCRKKSDFKPKRFYSSSR